MSSEKNNEKTLTFGTWQSAEDLRQWAFLRRTPQQRLDWLEQALTLAYQCGALEPPATIN